MNYTIAGIGANVFDTLITISSFPEEDTKMRADATKTSGGGPCATGLCAASVLGEKSAYIGILSDDNAGKFLLSDMEKFGVGTDGVKVESGFSSFSSCIWLNTEKATRTCVFDRGNLPPLALDEKQKKIITDAKILMVDGNELEAAIDGAKTARENETLVLYDAGGLYQGIDRLLPLADILIPSFEFATKYTQTTTAKEAATKLYDMFSPKVVVITMGKEGGVLYDGKEFFEYPAFPVKAVDSNGAGDVFHGAFAFCVAKGFDFKKACIFSSAVSALKCMNVGARESVPDYDKTVEFLKERNYNV